MSSVKLEQVRHPESQNDQLSPAQIITVGQPGGTANTEEQFQEAVLSQLKRIIWGPAVGNWYSNFSGSGVKSLQELSSGIVSGSVTFPDMFLETDPDLGNVIWTNTKSGSQVTSETWTNTVTSKLVKSIDYTYTSSKLTQEVRKVFGADGTTITAQATIVYVYSGNEVSSYTLNRDVTDTGGAVTFPDLFLEVDPDLGNVIRTSTKVGSLTSAEAWTNTATSKLVKSIDYTYNGNKIDHEVRKVFAIDGTTITAQATITYVYSGNEVSSYTLNRDV